MVQFSLLGRILSACTCLAFPIAAFFSFSGSPDAVPLAIYAIVLCPFMALIELPYLCACFAWCQCVAKYLKYIAGWWIIRAIIYIGLAAGGFAIAQIKGYNPGLMTVLVALVLDALLYIIATVRGEENPAYALLTDQKRKAAEAEAAAAKKAAGGSSGGGGGGLFGLFSRGKVEATVGAAAVSGASMAAKSEGKRLFGGGDVESDPAGPPPPSAPPTSIGASIFGGGGLFGGGPTTSGAKRYGGEDTPESNPFLA